MVVEGEERVEEEEEEEEEEEVVVVVVIARGVSSCPVCWLLRILHRTI
jgi:hypothetical protein